ncbi:TNF receptor-associated factor 6-A-like [Ornithodoros turicata]|uniref:TNF receptor-associated factor 6-A-like n=1 Tax=Ornithodoros turicata TaxID=34597 RepID=UPI003138E615
MAALERRLVGYSEAMDWRVMNFMDLISLRACSLCNVVPKVTLVLECSHALCELCYENVLQGKRQCPLDGEAFDEIHTTTFVQTARQIWRQTARCLNFNLGCDFVGTVAEVEQHFFQVCTFHGVTCGRCHEKVLRKEIVDHYVQQCGSRASPIGCSAVDAMDAILEVGKKIDTSLEVMTDRLSAIEGQLRSHGAIIGATKDSIVSNADILKDFVQRQESHDSLERINDKLHVLMQQMEELTKCTRTAKSVLSNVAGLDAVGSAGIVCHTPSTEESSNGGNDDHEGEGDARARQGGSPVQDDTDKVKDFLRAVLDASKRICSVEESLGELKKVNLLKDNVAYYHFQGLADIEKEVLAKQRVVRTSGIFRLCGYSMKLEVVIKTYDRVAYIGVFLRICRSSRDSFLKWPFTQPYTVILVNPTDERKNAERHIDVLRKIDEHSQCFNKPEGDCNMAFGIPELCKLQDAVKEGFIRSNSATVGVRIL